MRRSSLETWPLSLSLSLAGDPSITSKKASKRDRLMERERVRQEEYEYRLRRLTRENEQLTKKFRLFALITVIFILVAVLSLALIMCMKMLTSDV